MRCRQGRGAVCVCVPNAATRLWPNPRRSRRGAPPLARRAWRVRRTRAKCHMIRHLKRRSAIGSYFWRLSQAVSRRFGKKNHYSIAEVSKAAEGGSFDIAFIAYAHAMFCSRDDFDAYYGPLQVACTYDGLRRTIARRFFGGATGFDAANILLRADSPMEREYDFTDSAPAD